MSNIQEPLKKIFDRHRIVFWYDTDKELRADYEALDLPDVIKVELDNNEFGIKHRILRKEPKAKFLIYHEGEQPDDLNNWLLDVLLAQGEFRTDQAS
ncbi:MAG: BREX-1 system phosphatase PglZ type A, partial [Thermodesulfobacteriota bacterium]|nr:BREX-1 system phosphatase PglZ type A [Thermodesulfobacteriota bacterium]